jgi:secondary thiamine-phosphate synthase enzyme
MQVRHEEHTLDTQGHGEVHDVTDLARKFLDNSGLREGLCTVFVAHSTCGVTVIECEPGANADLNQVLARLAPEHDTYEHNELNDDTNGHSHARAGLLGPSATVPFTNGELMLGVWQKVVCLDFDDRPRVRRLVVHLIGE